MANIDERIAALEEKAKKLREQKKAKEELAAARKLNAMIKGRRSDDTRRKILIGAFILADLENPRGPLWVTDKAQFMAFVGSRLTRDDERALFGLPPRVDKRQQTQPQQPASPAPAKPPFRTS